MTAANSIPSSPQSKPTVAKLRKRVVEVVSASADTLTPADTRGRPAKPYPEFPLTAHLAGYWCQKIRGKIHYFGPTDDPDAALATWASRES